MFFGISALGIYIGYRYQYKAPSHFTVSYDKIDTKEEYNLKLMMVGDALIHNSVYEAYKSDNKQGLSKGKKCNCRLDIRADISGSSGRLYGKWSPDSVGNYPVANP